MSANQPTILHAADASLAFLRNQRTITALQEAATGFIKHSGGSTEIWAASHDWFLEEWGRDTFISLPGLLLTAKRYAEARQVFLRFAGYERHGLIPNVISKAGILYNAADASLWFINALEAYVRASGDWSFVKQLLPTIRSIVTAYTEGTVYEYQGKKHHIGTDKDDGLIVTPAQATWMDADPAGDGTTVVTPRNGKCVEINALWYGALRFIVTAERQLNNLADVSALEQAADFLRTSYRNKFWNVHHSCLFDVIEGDPHGSAIRPNQIIAISHGRDLLRADAQKAVLEVVRHDLVTPGGLRTLSPRDPQYIGSYDTYAPMAVKDLAYHQGTAWPWIVGPYCDAVQKVRSRQGLTMNEIRCEIEMLIAPLVRFCMDSEFKSLPELFSGDPPFEPGGTTSQAWSVAEVLRVLSRWQLLN